MSKLVTVGRRLVTISAPDRFNSCSWLTSQVTCEKIHHQAEFKLCKYVKTCSILSLALALEQETEKLELLTLWAILYLGLMQVARSF